MKKTTGRRSVFTTVVAGAAVLTLFGTGSAVAGGLITSAKIKNNTIKSIDVRNGTLKGIDVADGGLTGADIAANSLTGGDVADGSLSNQDVGVLFAQISAAGVVENSSGGVTATHLSTGNYQVDWGRNVQGCGFVATQGEDGVGDASGGIVGVTDRLFNANAAFVAVKNPAAAPADLPFQIVAVC
jgi:hypothetical protein